MYLIICIVIAFLFYLVIVGANINKSEEERFIEVQEQMKFLTNIKEEKENEKRN